MLGNNTLAERIGVSPQTMRTILAYFESEGMISRDPSRQGTVFTVLNYALFQGEKDEKINQRPPTPINQRPNQHAQVSYRPAFHCIPTAPACAHMPP